MNLRCIGVVHKVDSAVAKMASEFIELAVSAGFKVYAVSPLKHRLAETMSIQNLSRHAELLVCIGGDGTLLSAVRNLKKQIPVLGINVGGRGVLAEIRPEEMRLSLERISSRKYLLERRIRLRASYGSSECPPALNELYVCRASRIKTPTYNISLGNGTSFTQRMDGLVISTPTGSTGHSYSLGGPVLSSTLPALVLTPAGSISRLPPIVIPVEPIEITSDEDQDIVIDGQEHIPLGRRRKVIVTRHDQDAIMVRFDNSNLRQLTNLGFR